jgi:hypothetical protein
MAKGQVLYNYDVTDFVSEKLSGLSVFYKMPAATSSTPTPVTRAATKKL